MSGRWRFLNHPSPLPTRERLRLLADELVSAGLVGAAEWVRAFLGAARPSSYAVALACEAVERYMSDTSRTICDGSGAGVARVAADVAAEMRTPPPMPGTPILGQADLILAACDAAGILADVLLSLRLSVAHSRGVVLVQLDGRTLAALSLEEWQAKLDAAVVPQ